MNYCFPQVQTYWDSVGEVCIHGSHCLKVKYLGLFTPELQLPSLFYLDDHTKLELTKYSASSAPKSCVFWSGLLSSSSQCCLLLALWKPFWLKIVWMCKYNSKMISYYPHTAQCCILQPYSIFGIHLALNVVAKSPNQLIVYYFSLSCGQRA